MGGMKSKKKKHQLPQEDVQFLLETTCFTAKQIKKWYKGFMRDCPNGELSRNRFMEVYKDFFPDDKAQSFYEHVFRTFDEDNSGMIDFKEFLQAISITQGGKPEQKLDLAFRLYDIDRNGGVDQTEMTEIMKSIYLMASQHEEVENLPSPEQRAIEIFAKMDVDGNGSLTKQEFIKGCMEDSEIFRLLTCSDDSEDVEEDSGSDT